MRFLLPLLLAASAVQATPTTFYLMDVIAEKPTGFAPKAMTASLCSVLSSTKGVDAICAPEIRGLLDFSGQLTLMGGSGLEKIEARVAETDYVLTVSVKKTGDDLVYEMAKCKPIFLGGGLIGAGDVVARKTRRTKSNAKAMQILHKELVAWALKPLRKK